MQNKMIVQRTRQLSSVEDRGLTDRLANPNANHVQGGPKTLHKFKSPYRCNLISVPRDSRKTFRWNLFRFILNGSKDVVYGKSATFWATMYWTEVALWLHLANMTDRSVRRRRRCGLRYHHRSNLFNSVKASNMKPVNARRMWRPVTQRRWFSVAISVLK